MKEGWKYIQTKISQEEILDLLNLKIENVNVKKNELYQNKNSNARLSLSKIYKDDQYPFHNDGVQYIIPPKYIILQNDTNNHYKTKTLLIDGFKLAEQNKPLFYNSIFRIRGNNGYTERTTIINFDKIPNQALIRFNPVIMDSIILDKKDKVLECLKNYKNIIEIEWKPYSTLIIDNWRFLHSRSKNVDLHLKREIIRTEIYI